MNILGIDCGASGALAMYDGTELLIWDMPVYELRKGKTVRKRVDFVRLCEIIKEAMPGHVYIEQVSAQFGNGAASAFSFGQAVAAVDCAALSSGAAIHYVTPQAWKKAMQCPAEKDGARMRASQLLPAHRHNWDLKKHDGRAESAMIALYGYQKERQK
jgi:crossover junction endodeoxyribonuclease RuvC